MTQQSSSDSQRQQECRSNKLLHDPWCPSFFCDMLSLIFIIITVEFGEVSQYHTGQGHSCGMFEPFFGNHPNLSQKRPSQLYPRSQPHFCNKYPFCFHFAHRRALTDDHAMHALPSRRQRRGYDLRRQATREHSPKMTVLASAAVARIVQDEHFSADR